MSGVEQARKEAKRKEQGHERDNNQQEVGGRSCRRGVGGWVFGTVAWLTDTAGPVNNVFSVGNVKIGLTETTTEFKMVPGIDIDKDPVVTVKANSEDAWLFVKVEENASLASYLTYAVDTGWTALADHPGGVRPRGRVRNGR